MSLNRLCLVINASYEAINVTTARRALKLVFKGAAVVEEVSGYTIRTANLNVPVPSVVRLMKYRRMPRQNRAGSRKGILLRLVTGNCFKYDPDREPQRAGAKRGAADEVPADAAAEPGGLAEGNPPARR